MSKLNKIFTLFLLLFISSVSYASVIPFDYIDGKIVIPVEIDNQKYNFIFDSGALTLISSKINNLSASKSSILFEAKDANQNKDIKDVYVLKSLKVGNVNIKNVNFSTINTDWLSQRACMKIDGILGANALDGNIWKIDFLKKIIFINDNIYSEGIIIPFKKDSFTKVPKISGKIRGKNIDFLFDTGSNSSISVSKSIYNSIKDDNVIQSEGFISQSVNSNSVGIREIDKMSFHSNDIDFGDQIIDSDNYTLNIIGTMFMENFIVILDFVNNKLQLKKQSDNLSLNSFGFALAPVNNKLQIVNKYNIKSTCLLQLSDIITKVDDLDTKTIDDEKMCKILQKLRSNNFIDIYKENGMKLRIIKVNIVENL